MRAGLVVGAGIICAAGLFVVAAVPPTSASLYPKCQFHQLTALHCPGCGATRGLHALLNGRPAQAVAYNALVFLGLPVLGLGFTRTLWYRAKGRRKPAGSRWPVWTGFVFGVGSLVFGVLRNVPVYPFTLLAPHELSP